jgi:predicted permease
LNMNWLQRLLQRNRLERELENELQHDLHLRIEALISKGLNPHEAARRARIEFGGADEIKEACRDARGARWLEDFIRDCRYGLRVLGHSPLFTIVAILSLALGIGANTAIFSLMDRVVFRMMPVRHPERLVQITRFHPPYGPVSVSYPLFQSLAKGLVGFEGLLARSPMGVRDIAIDGNSESANFDLVSGSYYRLLGVNAAIGRTFDEDADRAPGSSAIAVIGHRYWERRFASSPTVIGKTFRRLDTVFTIVGVTPPEFFGTVVGQEPDITVPIAMDAQVRGGKSWLNEPNYGWISVMGRLKPGRSINQAQAEAKRAFANIVAADAVSAESDIDRRGRLGEYVGLQPGGNGFDNLRRRFAEPLAILMGTVALVLLLACANLANLLLAKSAVRRREIAVRLAIGAGRWRVVRQLFAEGLLLALAGGTLGVLLAYWFAAGLVAAMSNGGPRMLLDVAPDARMLVFAATVSIFACVLFSLTPVLQATRQSFQPALAEARAGGWRLGKGLIVAQMAITVLLLIGAGLFGRTLLNMYSLDPGFERRGVVLFSTNAAQLRYTRPQFQQMQLRVPAELETLPGVVSASMAMFAPISGGGWDGTFDIEGHPSSTSREDVLHVNSVGVDFFKTFRTPVVLGREFNLRDTEDSQRVVIVNQAFARYYFPDHSPLGKWVAFQGPDRNTHYQIVGVVKDVKYESLRHDFPKTIYFANAQVEPGPDSYTFAVRTEGGMATALHAIGAALAHVDAQLRPVSVVSLGDRVTRSLLQERMLATLAGFFGALALLLGAVGIYGTMAFQVARRRREIGIRMALGADAGSVIGMVLGQTARLTLLGCVIGAAAGLALTRLAQGILYGVGADDPATFATATAALMLIALAAAYLPGRSAARTNPIETLRVD